MSQSLNKNGTVNTADVKAAVVDVLGIEDQAATIDAATPLSSMPQLDSMAVLELLAELEARFAITVDDQDVKAEVFETIGSLTAFVETKSR